MISILYVNQHFYFYKKNYSNGEIYLNLLHLYEMESHGIN
jgi:hypothetical protein